MEFDPDFGRVAQNVRAVLIFGRSDNDEGNRVIDLATILPIYGNDYYIIKTRPLDHPLIEEEAGDQLTGEEIQHLLEELTQYLPSQ